MLHILHDLLSALYLILPPAALLFAIIQSAREKTFAPVKKILITIVCGLVIGLLFVVLFAAAVSGTARADQAFITGYFATGALLLLRLLDVVIATIVAAVFRLKHVDAGTRPIAYSARYQLASLSRFVLLMAIGIPYLIAAVVTYTPKVRTSDRNYQTVWFPATDGTRLAAWWVPASGPARSDGGFARGSRTVLLCPGWGADKSKYIRMGNELVAGGYNVLSLDFRAHGDSSGHLNTFGELERLDILGAVRWLRASHPSQSKRIFGIGIDTGAAALIAAAADRSEEGQAIAAIAVYGCYSRLDSWTKSLANEYFLTPVNWMTLHLSVPAASLQTGAPLGSFAPADLVLDLWPRPILVIHGVRDELVPYEESIILFNSATLPKDRYWLDASRNEVLSSETVLQYVKKFFDSAEPVPVAQSRARECPVLPIRSPNFRKPLRHSPNIFVVNEAGAA